LLIFTSEKEVEADASKRKRNTKKPRLQNTETAPIRHDLPEDWDFKSRRAKKYWLQSSK
jgi:hypothetical protein